MPNDETLRAPWRRLPRLEAARIFTQRWLREYGIADPPAFLVAMMAGSTRELMHVLSVADLVLWVSEMRPPELSVRAGTDECAEALLALLLRDKPDMLH